MAAPKEVSPCWQWEFSEGFDGGYTRFKIGATLRKAREAAGLSQDELAIKLSTLENVAAASGKRLQVRIA